jgi:phenylpyruvate tautomerase PptA (4-oxalocrotonate tautomerase family)
MAQVKIYGLASSLARHRNALSTAIHRSIVDALDFPRDKQFQRFLALEREDFIFPDNRSENYTIIEISMFEGRSREVKKALIRALFANLETDCGITPHDVEITITETPRANWGIRGQPGDELALSYRIHDEGAATTHRSEATADAIQFRVHEYVSDPFAEFFDVASHYSAVPVYSDAGGTLFLTPSLQVLSVRTDDAAVHEEHSTQWRTVALVSAAEKFPELHALLPTRPDNAPDCAACGGAGRIRGGARCTQCFGLGWPVQK